MKTIVGKILSIFITYLTGVTNLSVNIFPNDLINRPACESFFAMQNCDEFLNVVMKTKPCTVYLINPVDKC